nr:hypothetical protein GCM10020092_088060 [Actinoplanes digitatis]
MYTAAMSRRYARLPNIGREISLYKTLGYRCWSEPWDTEFVDWKSGRSFIRMRIGIVGATGQVGGVMRRILAERRFPLTSSGSSPPPVPRAAPSPGGTAR